MTNRVTVRTGLAQIGLRMCRLCAPQLSVSLLMLAPVNASAQAVATSFEELQALVKSGDTIDVIDATGRKTKGRLGDVSGSSFELLLGHSLEARWTHRSSSVQPSIFDCHNHDLPACTYHHAFKVGDWREDGRPILSQKPRP